MIPNTSRKPHVPENSGFGCTVVARPLFWDSVVMQWSQQLEIWTRCTLGKVIRRSTIFFKNFISKKKISPCKIIFLYITSKKKISKKDFLPKKKFSNKKRKSFVKKMFSQTIFFPKKISKKKFWYWKGRLEEENEPWALKRRKGEFPFIYFLGGQEGEKPQF